MTGALEVGRSYLSLARWLGPWTGEQAAPEALRSAMEIGPERAGDRPFEAWYYRPPRGRPVGAYLIAPGLHYAGPADPRMDRFCAILAAAGFAVLAPFLPDYTALRVAPGCFRDLERAFDVLCRRPELPRGARPGVFSISFGSLPALWLAGNPATRDRIGGVLVFGGYARWSETIRFCLTGEVGGAASGARDPLNQPVVFMNLIDELDDAPADPTTLLAAWRRYVEATWGRDEMKRGGAHAEVARRMAAELPASIRELFLIGCGALPGGVELANVALERSRERTAFLDPARHVAEIRCPVHLVHGVDDDVIPYQQSPALAELLPAAARPQVHLTGLYGHTSRAGARRSPAALARELATMGRILRAFVAVGRATDRAGSR